jgi:hypothetical protein
LEWNSDRDAALKGTRSKEKQHRAFTVTSRGKEEGITEGENETFLNK